MHPLLLRQLKKVLGETMGSDFTSLPAPWIDLAKLVDSAYQGFDADRAMTERSMEIASEELGERNRELLLKNQRLVDAEQQLRQSHDELERRVEERTRELLITAQRAEAANRAKSAFLANMSHEIRTPMTAILGYADMLLAPVTRQEERIDQIHTIRRQGEHLLSILNDILDISKIEADKIEIEKIHCDPCRVVSEAMSLMRVRATEKKLRCEVMYLGPIPQTIQTDPTRLRQILLNLLGNSIKFTEAGGVQVVVSMGTDQPQSKICFEVIDSGIGMGEEQISSLFKPFMQADETMTRRFGGTGLGLSICKRLTQMLGGDISVQSRPGCGSRFVVTIDPGNLSNVPTQFRQNEAFDVRPSELTQLPAEPALTVDTQLVGRVLLAEDGIHNQRVMRHYLERAGLIVDVADNGRVAVEMATAAEQSGKPYDVILMDMQMPELDGYGATSLLRSKAYTRPVIAVTAHAMASDRQKCIAAGCDEFLTKPINHTQLLQSVSAFLGKPVAPHAIHQKREVSIDSSALASIVEGFVSNLPERVAELTRFVRDQNVAQLKRELHNLKGTGGMYGFPQISELATAAERDLIDGKAWTSLHTSIEQLTDVLQSVQGESSNLIAAPAK